MPGEIICHSKGFVTSEQMVRHVMEMEAPEAKDLKG